jgi:cell division protease FtsH
MISRLAVLMGGRVAEEIIFGKEKVTSGAASDIDQATRLARMMVTRWGYSDELGVVAYGENQDEVFLGMSVSRTQNISEDTARKIDAEIKRLVEGGYQEARRIISEKREELERLAKALLEYETLTGDEIHKVLRGEALDRPLDQPAIQRPPAPALPVTDEDEPVPHDPRNSGRPWPDPAPA